MSNPFSQLNDDQTKAAALIKPFLNTPSNIGKTFTLTGGPGTGKTYMLKEVLDEYKGIVQAATVSHAAKNILQQSLGTRVEECITLAKLLGLTQTITDDGLVKFARPKDKGKVSQIGKAGVLVIDEVSQIPDDIYELIVHEIQTYGVKLIAVGDPYQLPPVEQETDSKFFNKIHARLTTPMRFQGPISDLAKIYRDQIDLINTEAGFDKWALNNITRRVDNMDNGTGYMFTNRLDSVIERAASDIKSHPDDLSYARVLAFKNESVAEINRRIRERLYGSNLAQFERSELVICNGGYSTMMPSPYSNDNSFRRTPVLYNGQILKVNKYKPASGPEGIPCVLMSFENFPNPNGFPIYVVQNDPDSRRMYDETLSKLLRDAKKPQSIANTRLAWKRYYGFIESFAYFDYSYSVNLYRAQGQTLTNVYVCEGEVMNVQPLTWKQKFQALYVAMTRAKSELIIYNKEF